MPNANANPQPNVPINPSLNPNARVAVGKFESYVSKTTDELELALSRSFDIPLKGTTEDFIWKDAYVNEFIFYNPQFQHPETTIKIFWSMYHGVGPSTKLPYEPRIVALNALWLLKHPDPTANFEWEKGTLTDVVDFPTIPADVIQKWQVDGVTKGSDYLISSARKEMPKVVEFRDHFRRMNSRDQQQLTGFAAMALLRLCKKPTKHLEEWFPSAAANQAANLLGLKEVGVDFPPASIQHCLYPLHRAYNTNSSLILSAIATVMKTYKTYFADPQVGPMMKAGCMLHLSMSGAALIAVLQKATDGLDGVTTSTLLSHLWFSKTEDSIKAIIHFHEAYLAPGCANMLGAWAKLLNPNFHAHLMASKNRTLYAILAAIIDSSGTGPIWRSFALDGISEVAKFEAVKIGMAAKMKLTRIDMGTGVSSEAKTLAAYAKSPAILAAAQKASVAVPEQAGVVNLAI